MSGDSEPLLSERDEPILPITDRRAPVLSRLRERRRKRNSVGFKVGDKIAELAVLSTEEERIEQAEKIRNEFIKGLSNGLGIPQESIEPDLIDEFTAMFTLNHEDIIIEEEQEQEEDEDDVDEEEDDSSTF